MARVRVSTTVDADLLDRARRIHAGQTDASLVEAALEALVREHEAQVDDAYLRAYRRTPINTPDQWGDLTAFLDAAGDASPS